jgi:group I intron endonuclease
MIDHRIIVMGNCNKNSRTNVYVVTCVTNNKRYVGITTHDVMKRWRRGHVAASNCGSNHALHVAIRKHGADKFVVEHHSCCLSRDTACEEERRLVVELDTHVSSGNGYNMTSGGDGFRDLSEEACKRIADAHRKENLSADTIKKMRDSKLGRKFSRETREKMSAAHSGKRFTEEHKRKLSESQRRVDRSHIKPSRAKPVQQLTLDGTVIAEFESMAQANKETGTRAGNISGCCCGTRKKANGFMWRYSKQSDTYVQQDNNEL